MTEQGLELRSQESELTDQERRHEEDTAEAAEQVGHISSSFH